MKTCFDHNFSRSSPIRPSFCTLPELILLSTKQTLNPRKNALPEQQNYRAEQSPRGLEISNSLRETKKGRKSEHLSNSVPPLQTSPTQKTKNGPSTTLQAVENGTLVRVLAAHMAANDRRQVRLVFRKGKMTENFAIFDQSFFGCIDEFLDSLFTVGEYKPESRSRTFKFTEIRRKKYSKICRKIRKFRLCRQISTSKKSSKKKLKTPFGYISTSPNRFGTKNPKIR